MFVDVGHSSTSVSVVALRKACSSFKGSAYDRHLEGRNIDYALLQCFATLAVGCERLKNVLSTNIEAPLNFESIMNDVDASSKLCRDEYERFIAKISRPLEEALAERFHSCPRRRARIQAALGGKSLSTTLNQDETIARGAIFALHFSVPHSAYANFTCEISRTTPSKSAESVPKLIRMKIRSLPSSNFVPSTKVLTLYRKHPFDIEARYLEPEGLLADFTPGSQHSLPRTYPPIPGVILQQGEQTAPMDVDVDATPAEAPPKKRRVKKMHAADKLVQDIENRKNALEEYVYDTRGKLDDRYAL
ncbi:hypothetical protein BU15DRAFT_75975 [Melanogaster broomeanus]|nr:hypothetical protein BU15DRAFT_75975 [Melanogaster broomeanus]